ncbi:hypothetical protein OBBRIDRAFT_788618 [Obba rivulosa]|uniref:Uncharacterized protein n=1 Tax=Obba rivulosa TaxID=1052685 RepID=A0A8E2DSS4_9APHY|nr:hypothetical protein OBBRIDRAFT_788618 [Obba rivulosa]
MSHCLTEEPIARLLPGTLCRLVASAQAQSPRCFAAMTSSGSCEQSTPNSVLLYGRHARPFHFASQLVAIARASQPRAGVLLHMHQDPASTLSAVGRGASCECFWT